MTPGSAMRPPGLIALVAAVLLLGGCSDDNCGQYACESLDASESSTYIRDYSYAAKRVFDLGVLRDPLADTLIRFLRPDDEVVNFELFVSAQSASEPGARAGWVHAYWPDQARSGMYGYNGQFRSLSATEAPFVVSSNSNGHHLFFQQPSLLIMQRVLAYYVEFLRDGVIHTIGDKTGDSLQLQLLANLWEPVDDPLWVAEWKNVYDCGIRGNDYDNLTLDIYRGNRGTETSGLNPNSQGDIPYLQLLGLDRTNRSGDSDTPDGRIDDNSAILDLVTGLLIFPDRRPFDTDVGYAVLNPGALLDPRVPTLYDSTDDAEKQAASEYYIEVTVRARHTTATLEHANLIPGSESVTFNGRRLSRGTDYTIDYEIGQIQLLAEEILDPSGELEVCYDYCP